MRRVALVTQMQRHNVMCYAEPEAMEPPLSPPNPDAGIEVRLESLRSAISRIAEKRDRLQSMVEGMQQSQVFTAEEIEVVTKNIKRYNSWHSKLQASYDEKSTAFTIHVAKIKDLLLRRRDYLAGFDAVLVDEAEIASVLVKHQGELEHELTEHYKMISRVPKEETLMMAECQAQDTAPQASTAPTAPTGPTSKKRSGAKSPSP